MDWTQVLAVFATVIALYCQQNRKLDEHRKETNEILRAIQIEMKEFHGRLCAIEERGKK